MLLSKMAANMAAEKQKYVFLRLQVSYIRKWNVEFSIFTVKESIFCSGISVGMLLFKMAANMAAKTKVCISQLPGDLWLQMKCQI
jgi:hypothetical protein